MSIDSSRNAEGTPALALLQPTASNRCCPPLAKRKHHHRPTRTSFLRRPANLRIQLFVESPGGVVDKPSIQGESSTVPSICQFTNH